MLKIAKTSLKDSTHWDHHNSPSSIRQSLLSLKLEHITEVPLKFINAKDTNVNVGVFRMLLKHANLSKKDLTGSC